MIGLCLVLMLLCIGQFFYIAQIRKQLAEWLDFLKDVQEAPGRSLFVKGDGILAEINFELSRILEKHRQQLVKLQRAEMASKQLLTNLSHDVRTPLASLVGYLEALDSQAAKEKEEYIHVAYRKAIDLQGLIDLLFQWFKLASHEQLYQIKAYDINELTRQVIIEHIPIFEKSQIAFSASIPEEVWLVKIDSTAYARIVGNLLSNAIKHGKCSMVEIRVQKREGQALVSVSNDGAAIPEHELPFVFDRLYQCGGARPGGGDGLGLAIVSELAGAMSGEITVQSIQQGKTTFYLALPLHVREN